MNASAIARIAKIIPLAVVAAVGVTACGPTDGGASLAAPTTTPAATSSTTPAPATPTTEATPTTPAETATAKTDTKTAAKTAAKTTGGTSGTGGIAITFNGLDQNGQIGLGDLVPFSVTWKNNDTTGTRSIVPVVATQPYEGAPCPQVFAMAAGTLERKDASGWKTLDHLSQGTGMDHVLNRNEEALTLTAGQSRTIEYRMRLSQTNRPGPLVIEADAPAPHATDIHDMAKAEWHAAAVDFNGPWVSTVSTTDLRAGTTPTEFGFTATSPRGTADLRPEVVVSSPYGLTEEDIVLEAKSGDGWTPVPLHDDCGALTATAPTGLEVKHSGDSAEYVFRITTTKPSQHLPNVQVGARTGDHLATLQYISPR